MRGECELLTVQLVLGERGVTQVANAVGSCKRGQKKEVERIQAGRHQRGDVGLSQRRRRKRRRRMVGNRGMKEEDRGGRRGGGGKWMRKGGIDEEMEEKEEEEE